MRSAQDGGTDKVKGHLREQETPNWTWGMIGTVTRRDGPEHPS